MAFSIFSGKGSGQGGGKPRPAAGKAAEGAAASPARPAPGAVRTGPVSSMNIEVGGSGSEGSVGEEAAILYANGQLPETLACLNQAVDGGCAEERAWRMLLDLHQVAGERARFEHLALEYAKRFERSAPTWREPVADAVARLATPAAPATPTGAELLALSGRLSAASAPELQKLRALADKSGGNVRAGIDFSRLAGADATGCRMLLDVLQALRKRGVAALFSGEATLLSGLAQATRQGARKTDPALWLLRMEILQWLGRQEEFEATALDYAVTFEVSPPSFEPHPAPAASLAQAPRVMLGAPAEIAGDGQAFMREIEAWAASHDEVCIDLGDTRRIGFVAAGSLLNLLTKLRGQGKAVQLEQPNALVAALLELMGLSEVATIRPRR